MMRHSHQPMALLKVGSTSHYRMGNLCRPLILSLYLGLFLSLSFSTFATPRFDFNAETVSAYRYALRLQLKEAQRLSDVAKQNDADNLAPYLVDNYIDFLTLYFDEDPAEYKKRKTQYVMRIDKMQQGPSNAALTLFSQAIIHLQWAAVKIKFGDKISAGFAFRDAFKVAMQSESRFPTFTPNLLITGAMQMAAGTIPQNLKWLSNLMGISGNLQRGKAKVESFLAASDPWARLFHDEGVFYYVYLQYYLLNQPDEALQYVGKHNLDLVNNHVFAYMASNLYLNNKQSQKALGIINSRNNSDSYFESPVWDFEMAYAKLYALNPAAEDYFKRYHASYRGNNYLKDSWLKRGWMYLISGNNAKYLQCMAEVKRKGNTNTEADKTALREALLGKTPNTNLLKARLLNDGGYNSRALQMLQTITPASLSAPEDKLEYTYRLGRVNDDLGQYATAIAAYEEAYNLGKHRPEYYAARASLQIGLIYEKRGQNAQAIAFYQRCIDLRNHDYEDSLEQKAKAGISRCEGK